MSIRNVNVLIPVKRIVEETQVANKEEIVSYMAYKDQSIVIVETNLMNDLTVLKNEVYRIQGETYELLMSENSMFESGKVKGEFRENDLFKIIDVLRSIKEP